MPTPTKGPRLGAGPAHQRLLLAGLATALFEHGRITTTEAKARRLRPYAEALITKAKRGDQHARRQVMRVIRDKGVVHVLFTEIGPRYATRPGGYTRITKVGPRKGDNAPMAVIELVEPLAEQVVAEATGATRRSATTRTGSSAAGTSATATAGPAVASAPAAGAGVAAGATPDGSEDAATDESSLTPEERAEREAFAAAERAQEAAEAGDVEAALEAADVADAAAEEAGTEAAEVAAEAAGDAAGDVIDTAEDEGRRG